MPADASDIRDQEGENFAVVEALRLRAGTLDIVSVASATLGALVTLLVGVSVVRRTVRRAPAGERAKVGLDAIASSTRALILSCRQIAWCCHIRSFTRPNV